MFLGAWAGFFLLVSAFGNMISMQNSLKKGKSVSELIRKQVVKGCLLLIFAVLTESLLGYNGYLGNFRGDSKLYTWLFRIATNEALSHLKRSRRRTWIPFIDLENKLENTMEGDYYFDGDESQLKFQKAILKLPEKQRLVFNMKYFDEMKYDEIAEILDTSVGALKASYHHAVKKIKEFLTND